MLSSYRDRPLRWRVLSDGEIAQRFRDFRRIEHRVGHGLGHGLGRCDGGACRTATKPLLRCAAFVAARARSSLKKNLSVGKVGC